MSSSCEGERVCWVCLCGDEEEGDQRLVVPCRCQSRPVHPKCLARWQLQSAGRAEERTCRFCNATLPDWRPALTPAHLRPATPVVSVHFNGACYRIKVKPGAEGYQQFRRQLQKITGIQVVETMQVTFQCRAPDTAQELSFKGISAFDAAIHCAAVSAAERLSQQQQKAAAAAAAGAATTARCANHDGVATPTATSLSSDTSSSSTEGASAHTTPSSASFSSLHAGPSASTSSSSDAASLASSLASASSSPTAAGSAARAASLDGARTPPQLHDMHSVVHHHQRAQVAAVGAGQGGGERACVQEHSGAIGRVRDAFRRLLAIS